MSNRVFCIPVVIGSLAVLATVLCACRRPPKRRSTRSGRKAGGCSSRARACGPWTVGATNGTIRVTGDGGADVRLEATMAFDAETKEALSMAQRDVTIEEAARKALTVTIAVRDGGAPTCGEQGNWRQPAWWDRRRYDAEVTLTIQVPRDVRVRLCTVNGGEAVVRHGGRLRRVERQRPHRAQGMRGSGRGLDRQRQRRRRVRRRAAGRVAVQDGQRRHHRDHRAI